jgi:hypothetical protein
MPGALLACSGMFWGNEKQAIGSHLGGWAHLWIPIQTSSFAIITIVVLKDIQPHRHISCMCVSQGDATIKDDYSGRRKGQYRHFVGS